jgi:hypothetical protein
MSYYDTLENFKASVRIAQSGSADDTMNYERVVGSAGGVLLLGPYGIRSDEWQTLTEQAGIPGARWQDRYAQEAVINHQFTMLYNRYGGQWSGVALAWRAGTGVADRVVADGEPIASVVDGDGADELQLWLDTTVGSVEDLPYEPTQFTQQATSHGPFATVEMMEAKPQKAEKQVDPEQAVTEMLTALRDSQVKGKEAMLDGTTEVGEQGVGGNVAPGTVEGSGV